MSTDNNLHQQIDSLRQQLQHAEARRRAIMNSIRQTFVAIDANRRVLDFCERTRQLSREIFNREMAVGDLIDAYVFPHDQASFDRHFKRALRGEKVTVDKLFHGDRDYIFSVTYTPIVEDDGTISGVYMISEEISERIALNRRMRTILESISDAFFALDDEWNFTYVNTQAERLLQRLEVDLLGHNVWEEFPEAVDTAFYTHYHKAREAGEAVSFTEYYSPLEMWLDVRAYPTESGGLSVYFADVTERYQRTLEHRHMSAIVENSSNFVGYADLQGEIIYVNPAGLEMCGYESLDEVKGEHVSIFQQPGRTEFMREVILPHVYEYGSWEDEGELVRKDGSTIPVQQSVFPVKMEGEIIGMGTVLVDVTAIQRAEQFAREVLDSLSPSICIIDDIGEIIAVNQTWRDFARRNGGDRDKTGVGVNYLAVCDSVTGQDERWAAPFAAGIRAVLAGERDKFEMEYPCNSPTEEHWYQGVVTPMVIAGERQAVITHEDITERKKAEQALAESEERYRTLVENFPNGIVALYDKDLRFTLVNGQGARRDAIEPEEMVGKTLAEIYGPDIAKRDKPALLTALSGGTTVSIRTYQDQTYQVYTLPIRDSNGEIICGMVMSQDITEQKKTERQLAEQQRIAEALRSSAEMLITTLDTDEVLDRILKSVAEVLPYDAVHIFLTEGGMATSIRRQGTHLPAYDDELNVFVSDYPLFQHMEETSTSIVVDNTADDKRWLSLESPAWIKSAVGAPLRIQGEVQGFLLLLSSETGTYTTQHADHLRAFADQAAAAIYNARLHEQLTWYANSLEERVLERTSELLEANERLRALSQVKDEFVSNVSHELRSPITSLKVRQHLLERNPEALAKHLPVLQRETKRLEHTIESLLRLSRLEQHDIQPEVADVDLNALAEQFVTDRQPIAKNLNLDLSFDASPGLPPVKADPNMLGEALGVLVTNALNYTPSGGAVTVRTSHQNGRAAVHVSDTGVGIPPEEQPRLFERFFRGQAASASGQSGTGLGLAIAHELISEHGGQIDVESEGIPGQGATFTIWLPVE